MDRLDALRLLAMRAVVRETGGYNLRYIFRWYSREFSTPLHVVESLPLDEVLTHFFESRYEGLEGEERDLEIQRLLETEEERKRRELAEEAEDADALEFAKLSAEAEKLKLASKSKGMAAAAAELQKAGADLRAAVERLQAQELEVQVPVGPAPALEKLPPDIEMTFADIADTDFVTATEKKSG